MITEIKKILFYKQIWGNQMKKILLLILVALVTYSSSFAIGSFKVVVSKPGAAVDVQVRIVDYSVAVPTTEFTGATVSLTPNASGIIIADVPATPGILATDVNSSYLVEVWTGSPLVLTSQQRLDQMVFEQAQAGVSDNDGNITLDDAGELRFAEPTADGDNYTAFKSPALAGNVIYTLPVDAGTNNQVLTTDGTGTLSWTTPAGGGGGGCNIYGDGSAGDVTINSNTDWSTTPPTNGNYMFNSLTINGGVTLTVPSGTVIQCKTTFSNSGTITVKHGTLGRAWGGNADGGNTDVLGNSMASRKAYPDSETYRRLTNLGLKGGSAGGTGGFVGTETFGGNGGGTFTILAATGITNSGTINASGQTPTPYPGGNDKPGCGGGGGGFVLLASDANITNSGTINSSGGNGQNAGDSGGDYGGGGGGGGLIHFISPNADVVGGTSNVSGGTAGTSDGTGSSGGDGGASVGSGGLGDDAPAAGSAGAVLRTKVTDACSFINR